MAFEGPNYPTVVSTAAIAPEDDENWVNWTVARLGADDGSRTWITSTKYDTGDISYQGKVQGFGFAIPGGATIDGIKAEIEQDLNIGGAKDYRVQLLDENGDLVGDNKAKADPWPAPEAVIVYGGETDKWGWATVTAEKINDADFGLVMSVEATAQDTDIYCDFIRITVYYTLGAAYYHGLKVQGEGELALCDVGNHPLRIRKGGTTYGIELVAVDDPNASRIRIKTPAGVKAIRKYT